MEDKDWQKRFEGWVDRFGGELLRAAVRRTGGRRQLAEELTAEAWMVAWDKRHTFSGSDEDARRWLHRIEFNLAPKVWRKNRQHADGDTDRLDLLLAQSPEAPWNGLSENPDPLEQAQLLHCFEARADIERDILRMRFVFNPDPAARDVRAALSWSEIAAELLSRTGTRYKADQLRMRARRALKKLRDCLMAVEVAAQS